MTITSQSETNQRPMKKARVEKSNPNNTTTAQNLLPIHSDDAENEPPSGKLKLVFKFYLNFSSKNKHEMNFIPNKHELKRVIFIQ